MTEATVHKLERSNIYLSGERARQFISNVTAAKTFALNDAAREVLGCIRIECTGSDLRMTTTETHVAARITLPLTDPAPEFDIMVNAKQLDALLPKRTAFPKNGHQQLSVEMDGKTLSFTTNDGSFSVPILKLDPPRVDTLFEQAITDCTAAPTAEYVALNPDYLKMIASGVNTWREKNEAPIQVRIPTTELRPVYLLVHSAQTIGTFDIIIMPVRLP